MYSQHACTDSKGKFVFRTGDKICPTRNANVSDYSVPKDEASMSVMNMSVGCSNAGRNSTFMTGEQVQYSATSTMGLS